MKLVLSFFGLFLLSIALVILNCYWLSIAKLSLFWTVIELVGITAFIGITLEIISKKLKK